MAKGKDVHGCTEWPHLKVGPQAHKHTIIQPQLRQDGAADENNAVVLMKSGRKWKKRRIWSEKFKSCLCYSLSTAKQRVGMCSPDCQSWKEEKYSEKRKLSPNSSRDGERLFQLLLDQKTNIPISLDYLEMLQLQGESSLFSFLLSQSFLL